MKSAPFHSDTASGIRRFSGPVLVAILLLASGCVSGPDPTLPMVFPIHGTEEEIVPEKENVPGRNQDQGSTGAAVTSRSTERVIYNEAGIPVDEFAAEELVGADGTISQAGTPSGHYPAYSGDWGTPVFDEIRTSGFLETLISDQRHFYSRENAGPFMLSLGATGILANTRMDQEFADWYQDGVRSETTDDIAAFAKEFGEQWQMMGMYVGASLLGRTMSDDSMLAMWGDRSIRSMLVGVPPLLFMQRALGSSRPNDVPPDSHWDFWGDDNGASGHTFVGAVPFLVAAQMAERPAARATWTVLSTFAGWSRINDNDHYLSQVVMGWTLAWLATRSVGNSDASLMPEIVPVVVGETPGIGLSIRR